MENDFALYSRALLEGNAAEQEANELVDRITKILSPLSNWKRYGLSRLPEEIPHVLTKLGSPLNRNRQQIFVGSIVDDLQKLQSSMAKYAEATETAMEARGRMPADQQKQLAPPPWQFP